MSEHYIEATDDVTGNGGELHQGVQDGEHMTTAQGHVISDNQNSLTAGERGPGLLEDHVLREKLFAFDHERIPERVVHARGYGAHGTFETLEAIPELTKAAIFQEAGTKVDAFVRFSTVAGNKGSVDLARDVRGFAVKLYTPEGNWDIVGNNIPVFFIQDAIKFPDLIHAVKEEPGRGWPQAQSAHDTFWDFASLMPESMNMLLWTMSDRAIPRSFRFMEGFGVHSFRFINAAGEAKYVKFHWKPRQGVQSVLWDEAVKINGADPDFHRKDLYNAIESGDYPQWDLGVQVFDDDFADSFPFDILDATKMIPEEDVPVRIIGRLTLNRVVGNVFDEIEQVAFMTQNVIPGVGFTNDPLLQGRNFSYLDTQLKRLGSTNFSKIPVNAPRCPVAHFQRDGHMQTEVHDDRVTYEPNSFTGDERGPRANVEQGYQTLAQQVDGETRRIRPELFADHFSQPAQFYASQTDVEKQHIINAFAFELGKCERVDIRQRMVAMLRNVDETLASSVAEKLGLEVPEATKPAREPIRDLKESPATSMLRQGIPSFAGRKLGVLVTDGADASVIDALLDTFDEAGAMVEFVGMTPGTTKLSDGSELDMDHAVEGAPSVIFDAVALVGGNKADEAGERKSVKDFVSDAVAHQKFIGWTASAKDWLTTAGLNPETDGGCFNLGEGDAAQSMFDACAKVRFWDRDVKA